MILPTDSLRRSGPFFDLPRPGRAVGASSRSSGSAVLLSLGLTAVVMLAGGCGKGGGAPEAVPLAEAPSTVKGAFGSANAELKKAADETSQALADGAYDVSLGKIAELSSRPELSSEQRVALAQSRVAVMVKLQAAAAEGDARAKELLETHRASK